MTALLISIFACHPLVDSFQVLDISNDEYSIFNRTIPTLHTPSTMRGELGSLMIGGIFEANLSTASLEYSQGNPVRPHFHVSEGVAKPLDRDGLIAFSYYAHLQDSAYLLEQADLDLSPITPIDTAISPIIPDLSLNFLPLENAAYAPTAHCFILLSDLVEKDVPLAANKGIVAHEFGHAVFHFLTTGGTDTPKLVSPTSVSSDSINSLDEGLADVLGYLVSQRTDFIGDSLDNVDRALNTEHLAENVELLPGEEVEDSLLPSYNPYPLGSVFAATIWKIDQQNQSSLRTLNWVLETTRIFGEKVNDGSIPNSVETGYHWLDIFVDLANSADEKQLACDSIEQHFTSIYTVLSCS